MYPVRLIHCPVLCVYVIFSPACTQCILMCAPSVFLCVHPVHFYGCVYACTPMGVLHDIQPGILMHEPSCIFMPVPNAVNTTRILCAHCPLPISKDIISFFTFAPLNFERKVQPWLQLECKIYSHLSHGMKFKSKINPKLIWDSIWFWKKQNKTICTWCLPWLHALWVTPNVIAWLTLYTSKMHTQCVILNV